MNGVRAAVVGVLLPACAFADPAAPSEKVLFKPMYMGEQPAGKPPMPLPKAVPDQEDYLENGARYGVRAAVGAPAAESPAVDSVSGPSRIAASEPKDLALDSPSSPSPHPLPQSGRGMQQKASGKNRKGGSVPTSGIVDPEEKPRDAVGAARSASGSAAALSGSLGLAAPGAGRSAAVSPETLDRTFDAAGTRRVADELEPKKGGAAGSETRPQTASVSEGRVFVTVDLDLKGASDARDAVAELHRTAGFVADARFPPASREDRPGRVSIRGWVPADGVRRAVGVQQVQRLEAGADPDRPESGVPPLPQWRVTLRLREPGQEATPIARADASRRAADVLLRLRQAGASWRRTRSFDPAGGTLVVVASIAPRDLRRVLAQPDVLRIDPAAPELASAGPAVNAEGRADDPLNLLSRHPLLVLLALLFPLAGRVLRSYSR